MTTYNRILKLLSDGRWHNSNEICAPFLGGRQGGARISEMRSPENKGRFPEIEDRWTPDGKLKEYRIPKEPEQARLLDLRLIKMN